MRQGHLVAAFFFAIFAGREFIKKEKQMALPDDGPPAFGSPALRLPGELRGPLKAHMEELHQRYLELGWGTRGGFGQRPALIVIDLALWWTRPGRPPMGSQVDSVVEGACQLLKVARAAEVPVIFTTYDYDPADPPTPHDGKCADNMHPEDMPLFELDPRVERREDERIVRKKYASAFKNTNLLDMLTAMGVDTLIVTGVSTSHCVYATCRDAAHTFRVVVPREAVGERCELLHEVNLLDINIDLGDVLPIDEVVNYLQEL
jgi:nicotinamidase-related amidase